ncbi:MAG: Uma2 family endonuclease [Acidobacteria bacterium]|nr:Uma2 family endonuclease [Acidobacteriota bacterium]
MFINPFLTILDLSILPSDDRQYQLIEGEFIMSLIPSLIHQRVMFNMLFLLGKYLEQNPIGEVISSPALILSDFNCLVPDIVFIPKSQQDKVIAHDQLIKSPDLVIEILNSEIESDLRDRRVKRQLYEKYGVKEYWIISPENHNIEIYRVPKLDLIKILQGREILSSALLPGFYCLSQEIFRNLP